MITAWAFSLGAAAGVAITRAVVAWQLRVAKERLTELRAEFDRQAEEVGLWRRMHAEFMRRESDADFARRFGAAAREYYERVGGGR
jgi:hypothetical protein